MPDRIDMDLARALGDRHLRDAAVQAPRLGVVRLLADDAIVNTRAGQQTLWMLVNLLARQFAIIEELVIDIPRLRLHDRVDPFGDAAAEFDHALVALGQQVAGMAMRVRLAPCKREPDVVLVVGRSVQRSGGTRRIGVLGDGWRAMVGPPDSVPAECPRSELPFGPYLAACFGAAEVFKILCGSSTQEAPFFYSLWDGTTAEGWTFLADGPCAPTFVLAPAYLIGVGAVGQGFLATIVALDKVEAHFITIDKDVIDRTNLNRYPLARQRDVDTTKIAIASQVLVRRGIGVSPYDGLWPDYALDAARRPVRSDVDVLERAFKYRQVISCVDGNKARHDIQRFWPEHIIGASTQSMRLTVASYDVGAGNECLMCGNPIAPEPTVQELVEEIRRMPLETRRSLAEQRGIAQDRLEAYLTEPRCGLLGPSELRHFSAHARADWSVGFVSVAAGVVAASRLARQALEGRTGAWAIGNSLWLTFRPFGSRWMKFSRRVECECAKSGRFYQGLWL